MRSSPLASAPATLSPHARGEGKWSAPPQSDRVPVASRRSRPQPLAPRMRGEGGRRDQPHRSKVRNSNRRPGEGPLHGAQIRTPTAPSALSLFLRNELLDDVILTRPGAPLGERVLHHQPVI